MPPNPPRRTPTPSEAPQACSSATAGGTTGRAILLLHGLLFDRTMWWPVAAELATDGTVIAPDLPGHGETPSRGDCSPNNLAAQLAELIHNLGLRRAPIVVGHSTSAWLATTLACDFAVHDLVRSRRQRCAAEGP